MKYLIKRTVIIEEDHYYVVDADDEKEALIKKTIYNTCGAIGSIQTKTSTTPWMVASDQEKKIVEFQNGFLEIIISDISGSMKIYRKNNYYCIEEDITIQGHGLVSVIMSDERLIKELQDLYPEYKDEN